MSTWRERWVRGMIELLGQSTRVDEPNVEATIEATWGVPPWVPLTLLLAAAALIVYLYFSSALRVPRRWRLVLAGLRLTLVALVIWMMFGFAVRPFRTDLPDLVVLLDDSASMGTVDAWADADMSRRIEEFVDRAGLAEPSRLAQAKALFLRPGQANWAQELARRYRLKVHWLGTPTPTTPDENRELWLEQLRQRKAESEPSDLGDRVRTIVDDQRGRPTAAVVVVTDGITTQGRSWEDAARYARDKGVPLFLVGVGNDQPAQDIELKDLLAEEAVYVNDIIDFSFAVASVGYAGREVTVRLRQADRPAVLMDTQVVLGPDRQPVRASLRHRPSEEGVFEYLVEVIAQDGESNVENNQRSVRVEVRDQKIRVLFVQSVPSYEFRFLKNALARVDAESRDATPGPIELHTVLQQADLEYVTTDKTALRVFPVQREELFAYDVLILGDVEPSYWSQGVMENIRDFVTQRGGGLVLIAGPKFTPMRFAGTPLEELVPVRAADVRVPLADADLTPGFRPQPTRVGISLPLMQLAATPSSLSGAGESTVGEAATWNPAMAAAAWQQLPPLYWLAEADTLKPGTIVLAEHPTRTNAQGAKFPVICLQYVGAGKVLCHLTDETFRWRYRRGDAVFAQYWQQALRFLSRGALGANPYVELTADRRQYLRGEPVELRVRFLDDRLAPPREDGVVVMLEQAGARKRRIALQRVQAERGVFAGTLYNLAEGQYHGWIVTPSLEAGEPTCDFEVTVPLGEMARVEAASGELRIAAKLSQGKYYDLFQADTLLDELPEGRRVRIESLTPEPIWNSWKLALLFVVLLVAEWFLRRRVGLI